MNDTLATPSFPGSPAPDRRAPPSPPARVRPSGPAAPLGVPGERITDHGGNTVHVWEILFGMSGYVWICHDVVFFLMDTNGFVFGELLTFLFLANCVKFSEHHPFFLGFFRFVTCFGASKIPSQNDQNNHLTKGLGAMLLGKV